MTAGAVIIGMRMRVTTILLPLNRVLSSSAMANPAKNSMPTARATKYAVLWKLW